LIEAAKARLETAQMAFKALGTMLADKKLIIESRQKLRMVCKK
jgi:hypothetical protein